MKERFDVRREGLVKFGDSSSRSCRGVTFSFGEWTLADNNMEPWHAPPIAASKAPRNISTSFFEAANSPYKILAPRRNPLIPQWRRFPRRSSTPARTRRLRISASYNCAATSLFLPFSPPTLNPITQRAAWKTRDSALFPTARS